jgi:phospholipase/lecithinase/hemolysin
MSPAQGAFTSLQVFGDGVCTTTNGPGGAFYHGKRYCNGRVWVEVLAQRQGLAYDANKNWSYFGHYSPDLLTNLNRFSASADVRTTLFVVWVCDADFVYFMSYHSPYNSNNLPVWTQAIQRSLSNHWSAMQTLYAKGARTLVMPNAVDLTKVPYYVNLASAEKRFVRQRIMEFNSGLASLASQAMTSLPGLNIVVPDIFSLLDRVLAWPADYGLTNALHNGRTIDALSDPALSDKSLNGPGAQYVFWDYLDPTARMHAVVADTVQQLISPVQISSIAVVDGTNRLEITNIPLGRKGTVRYSTNFFTWTNVTSLSGSNAVERLLIPAADPSRFYFARFPFAWTWP